MSLYGELAPVWEHLSPPELYRQEAERWLEELRGRRRVLDLGCGAGRLLSHLTAEHELTAVDLAREMLEVSQKLNPGVRHLQGDMRSLRLGERFDAVLLHDAAAYLLEPDEVTAALETAAAHLEPGGLLLLQPDYVVESFPGDHTAHHGAGPQADVLEWCRQVGANRIQTTYVVLLGDRVVRDDHQMGLFSRAFWLEKLRDAGFRAKSHRQGGPHGQGVYWFSGSLNGPDWQGGATPPE